MAGAVPVRAAGALLGAVGVSGAPGGDLDEACAKQGLKKLLNNIQDLMEVF